MPRSTFLLLLFCLLAGRPAPGLAGDIYKWTDENGKVHFGDRSSAPDAGKKVTIDARTPTGHSLAPAPDQPPATRFTDPVRPAPPKLVEVPEHDLVKSDPRCLALAKEVLGLPEGTPFKHLTDQILQLCPGVAYECRFYRKSPTRNRCVAVPMTGKGVVRSVVTD